MGTRAATGVGARPATSAPGSRTVRVAAGTAGRPDARPRHLDSVDLMRVVTVAGVIAVHLVTGTNRPDSVTAGGATILLHVNRQVFVLLTALVLTYAYGFRDGWSLPRFWARRYWLVATPYVVWSVIYFLADGPPGDVRSTLRQLAVDLASGGARYHLYFLLVSMQVYLVFPALLWLVRATRGHHGLLLAGSLLAQLAFTAALHYHLPAPGPLGWWFAHPDALLPSYQLYVLAGAVGAFHLRELADWTRRHRLLVLAAVGAAVTAGLGSYLLDIRLRGQSPLSASQVFQPVVTVESLAAVLGMYTLGVWWADRRWPGWLTRGVQRASDASFGIYLAHPLVLQGLLAIGGLTGVLAWLLGLPSRETLAIDLVAILPLVLAITWAGTRVVRHSPLSLPLAGRPAAGGDRAPRPRAAWATDGLRTVAMAAILVGLVASLDLSSVRMATPWAADAAPRLPDPIPPLTAATAPVPPAGASSDLETVWAGGLQRTYQVIRPDHPVADRLPVVVFLHGVNASLASEEDRDGLLPVAAAGQVILVYPVGYAQSWNAGPCCGGAQTQDVDDLAFLTQVVEDVLASSDVDPARVSLVGYSNGGKMAYRLACARPGVFLSLVAIHAVPVTSCRPGPPLSLLTVAAVDDSELPYSADDGPRTVNGVRVKPVVQQVAGWRSRDGCSADSTAQTSGLLTVQRWDACREGARVELATYASGGHDWMWGDAHTPGIGQVVWSFVQRAGASPAA